MASTLSKQNYRSRPATVGDETRKERAKLMLICTNCGSTHAQANADSRALGLREEFETGGYVCCQMAAWADEQWLAWSEAAHEDGRSMEEATQPLEVGESEPDLTPVLMKLKKTLKRGGAQLH